MTANIKHNMNNANCINCKYVHVHIQLQNIFFSHMQSIFIEWRWEKIYASRLCKRVCPLQFAKYILLTQHIWKLTDTWWHAHCRGGRRHCRERQWSGWRPCRRRWSWWSQRRRGGHRHPHHQRHSRSPSFHKESIKCTLLNTEWGHEIRMLVFKEHNWLHTFFSFKRQKAKGIFSCFKPF